MEPRYRYDDPRAFPLEQVAPAVSRSLVATTLGLLAFSFVFSVIGGVVGLALAGAGVVGLPFFIILAIGQIALIFALRPVAARSASLGLLLLYSFTFLSGMSLGPVIGAYAVAAPGVLGQALLLTAIITAGLTIYGWVSEVSLARFGTWLLIGLLTLIGGSIVAIFVRATWLEILLGGGGAVLFSLFLVYDIQRLKQMPAEFANAVVMAAAVYLDIVNLFLSLLRLLGALSGSNRD
jgi:modulator of FtsH protease